MADKYLWWQEGIIYQVYPRSLQDSNGDGVGDLEGIIRRLDYFKWLGIGIIWLSPIYPSPMKDFGYDISDYKGIHEMFGTMQDFDTLLQEAHTRDIKIILDLVPNHTSDEHPWFIESRSSLQNPKRNWYIWADEGEGGGEPNNWLSVFGGSAWEWDEHTGQYYYHAFLKEQPDLNYREPAVLDTMNDIMRFWLKKGVDGFRIDVLWHLIKDSDLRNNPPNPHYEPHMLSYDSLLPVFSTDRPEVHDIVQSMRKTMDEFTNRVMIGEVYLPIDKLVTYYGVDNGGAQLPFNFLLLATPWEPLRLSSVIDEYISALPKGAWPNWVLGNHDQPRIRSRVGIEQARVAAILLLTLPGTPTMYYGDEIGMQDVPIPAEEQQDPQGLNMPEKNLSRDPARTPMQWDASPNGGFSTSKPWLRVDKMYTTDNVEFQKKDPDSILLFYKRLITLRLKEPALKTGTYDLAFADRQAIAYVRRAEGQAAFLIALNFTSRPCRISFQHNYYGTIAAATVRILENTEIKSTIYLSGNEGIVVRLKN